MVKRCNCGECWTLHAERPWWSAHTIGWKVREHGRLRAWFESEVDAWEYLNERRVRPK